MLITWALKKSVTPVDPRHGTHARTCTMPLRYPLALLAAALITFACGPRPHAPEAAPASTGTVSSARRVNGTPIASTLAVDVGDEISFALALTNTSGRRVELTFPNGLTHDVVVLDSAGRERWRWSDGRLFTQALQNRLLDAKEEVTFQESWQPALEPGTYVAVATLRSSSHPVEERATFTVR
jgi:hypothetical protein